MPTLILPPRFTGDTQALWRAAIAAGWDVERLASWRARPNLAVGDVVLYGEPLFAAVVAQSLGIALLEPPPNWVAELPEDYRRRWVRIDNLANARKIDSAAFVKPASEKCFPPRVHLSGAELPSAEVLDDSTPVLIAEPVDWEVEYRCFVLDRHVLTWSPYLRDGQLVRSDDGGWNAPECESQAALCFAMSAIADPTVHIPPAVVFDVGVIRGRGWAVIEANAAWGSGIYGCDPREVLKVVQRSCVRGDRLSVSDAEWVTLPNA